jgi:TolB-like protein/DNA-binding SARP family transcriptional activator
MFRLRAYGGLTLERDGVPYAGPAAQRRRLAVLAVIAASDMGVSRDRLADYFWPDADPARGRHSLDEALSGLRRELGNDDLFVGVATLRLNSAVLASDLADQAAAVAAGDAERAASLYAGPFLDGVHIPGAGDFERWVDAERERRARAHARVLEGLAARAAAGNDAATAARWWQARVALDPLDTPATLGLVHALTSAGNPAEALRLVRVHETLVRDELDTNPGPAWAAAVDGLRAELARSTAASVSIATEPHPATAAHDMAEAHGQAGTVPVPIASANRAEPAVAPAASAGIQPTLDEARTAARGVDQRRTQRRWPARLTVAAALVLLVGLAIFAVWMRRRTLLQGVAPASLAAVTVGRASVAVLPFANTGGDPADEQFSDGLTDEMIGALSKVPGLKVTGHTSAFALKGRGLTVRTIADTLGVATVLEGSVRRAGDRLKITVQLVSAGDNSVLWSESYDRDFKDVFAVQEEIARAIVGALGPTLGDRLGRVAPIRTRDLATYELYLKGRYFLGRRTPGDLRRAVDHFEQAVARDPTYAQAYAGLADARVLLVILSDSPPGEELPRARAAAAAAIRLDPTLAEAHSALGNIREAFDWDSRGADQEFARAVALDPGYATAHLYWGIHLTNRGRFGQALSELTQARAVDPLSAPVRMQLGRAYLAAGRPDQAVPSLQAAIELNPEFGAAYLQLGDAYLQQRRPAEALTAFRRAASLNGRRDSVQLAYALAATGQRAEAARLLAALLAAQHAYVPPVPVARAYVALGDVDASFRWLARGFGERAGSMRTIKVNSAFDPLHADPRWAPLLRRMGLEP